MPGETTQTGFDTGITIDGAVPAYPRITTDFYISTSVGVTPPGSTIPSSKTTYANVIVTLTYVEIDDFSTVWDNLKTNILANITSITT